MDVKLSPDAEQFIEESIASGQYGSAQEVLEAGLGRLRLDAVNQFDDELLAELEAAEQQIDQGQPSDSHPGLEPEIAPADIAALLAFPIVTQWSQHGYLSS